MITTSAVTLAAVYSLEFTGPSNGFEYSTEG